MFIRLMLRENMAVCLEFKPERSPADREGERTANE